MLSKSSSPQSADTTHAHTTPPQSHPAYPLTSLSLSVALQFSKDRIPTSCCLALAGPVVDNTCIITNLNWHIHGTDLSTQLRIPHVSLINDFVAAGYGCLALPPTSLTPLYVPKKGGQGAGPHAVKAIIGAGTGLGEAFAVWDEGCERVQGVSDGGRSCRLCAEDGRGV